MQFLELLFVSLLAQQAIQCTSLNETKQLRWQNRDHYPKRVSALDFKDVISRFGHSYVVLDLFIGTRFWRLIDLLSNFQKFSIL